MRAARAAFALLFVAFACDAFVASAAISAGRLSADSLDGSRLNVNRGPLALCGERPATGYYRDGYCLSGPDDKGVHVVCAVVTKKFLDFSAGRGNDLMTPNPPSFPGLVEGDRWCLCVKRWKEALDAGFAPRVVLAATQENALKTVTIQQLQDHAY